MKTPYESNNTIPTCAGTDRPEGCGSAQGKVKHFPLPQGKLTLSQWVYMGLNHQQGGTDPSRMELLCVTQEYGYDLA